MSTEHLTNQEWTSDNQDILSIEEQELQKTLNYLEENTTHCKKVGEWLTSNCDEIKKEMLNLVSFNNKVSVAYGKIKEDIPLTSEDESALKLYYVIKINYIPIEEQRITWRNSLNPINGKENLSENTPESISDEKEFITKIKEIKNIDDIQNFSTEEKEKILSAGKTLKESLKDKKDFTDDEKVLLDFYEMFEIYEAIQISELMDKLEVSIGGFLKTKTIEDLNQENINYSNLAWNFISYCKIEDTILWKLSKDKKKDLVTNKIVTFVQQSIESRKELIDTNGKEKSDWLVFESLASRVCSQWDTAWKNSSGDTISLEGNSISKKNIKVESRLPSIIITLPEKLYQYLIKDNSEGFWETRWLGTKTPICFINNKEDSLKKQEEDENNAKQNNAYLVNEDWVSPLEALRQAREGTYLHEPQHVMDKIFGMDNNNKKPFNEVLPRLAERQSLKGIMRDLMRVDSYDPYFKYENHKPEPEQANAQYEEELEKRNGEKVEFDKRMQAFKDWIYNTTWNTSILQAQLDKYLSSWIIDKELWEMAKDKHINNYLKKAKETRDTLKNWLRVLVELDCICDKDLMKENKREWKLEEIWKEKAENIVDWDKWKLNPKWKKDNFPKCIINTLSNTPIEDWWKICKYARQYGIQQCGISPCKVK